jgi:hypothetical protein
VLTLEININKISRKGGKMNFSKQDVENAINRFDGVVEDLLNSTHETYQSNIEFFMNLIKENDVINHIIKIIKTSLERPLKLSEFEIPNHPGIILELPEDMNIRIAYILARFDESLKSKIPMWNYASQIFHKSLDENIYSFNDQYVRPCMREIRNKFLIINITNNK